MSSGSQIGGVVGGIVGGVIGFYTGNVAAGIQYGYAIGSAVGGYVDPTRTYGPRLEDASQQTSTVGGVIPFGYGVFTCAGNIIWADRLVEHKKTERVGKGGSEKQTTYTYTRSYAIGVCEGPIHEYLWVKVNGKLVYASDPAGLAVAMGWTGQMVGDLVASSNEWLQSTTLYTGTDTQMPDSTIVAIEGVGNVSPFRDLAYIVKENEDLTDMQGAVSQHEFCVRATPPEAYLTSPPYPLILVDVVSESVTLVGGMLKQSPTYDAQPEQQLESLGFVGGSLIEIKPPEVWENVSETLSLAGGSLDLPPSAFDEEDVRETLVVAGGMLGEVPIANALENVSETLSLAGGSLEEE